ncbi:Cytochrome [Capsicum chinense]|nr:Cytochrome [Capsicum chinense]
MKEMKKMSEEAMSKPVNFSHDLIWPRISPFIQKTITKYGKNCFVWLGPKPAVLITEPELIREVLTKNYIYQKATSSPLSKLAIGGIASYEEDKWATHRRILNPAFHLDKLKAKAWFHDQVKPGSPCMQIVLYYQDYLGSEDLVIAGSEGKNCFVWLGPKPAVLITEPELIREVLTKNYIYHKATSSQLSKLAIGGIASYEEDKWATHRRILNTAFHLDKLKVTMIFNEVLRLYPSPYVINRMVNIEAKLGNLCLPSGVQLVLPTILLHHDTEIWGDDAMEFNPERFSEGISKATKGQVVFFLFSWGPRICIGQNIAMLEAKMVMTMILKHYAFELSLSYAHAPHPLLLQPQYGAQLIMYKL